uniref:Uncharacterized protein n=1 Tax=Rhizophora mucronata TaxID=61149 RepID=A0A2P2JJA0_RHIMU
MQHRLSLSNPKNMNPSNEKGKEINDTQFILPSACNNPRLLLLFRLQQFNIPKQLKFIAIQFQVLNPHASITPL